MDEQDCKELRKQKIRDTKTSLILDAALEVLSQKGYYETRLEDIADRAGFSKSALYRYYKDKDEIFFTIVVRERNKVFDKLTLDPQYRLSEENHISENIRRILTVAFTAFGENLSFLLTLNSFQVAELINNLQKQSELMEIEKDFLCAENKMAEIMLGMFDKAKEKGEINTKLDSEQIFDFVQGFIFTKVKKWHQNKKLDNIDETVNQVLIFLSSGLGFMYK
ncbi:MAG TPA: helix-turn-helix domain-containing protein [Chitinispirillaceae bacterium]|nr:helix-turn-helix domain-containing protein [Chitinispirillaceae bacterium]